MSHPQDQKQQLLLANCFGLRANNFLQLGQPGTHNWYQKQQLIEGTLAFFCIFLAVALANRRLGQNFFVRYDSHSNHLVKKPKPLREAYQELERRRKARQEKKVGGKPKN